MKKLKYSFTLLLIVLVISDVTASPKKRSAPSISGSTDVCADILVLYNVNVLGDCNTFSWSTSGGGTIVGSSTSESIAVRWTTGGSLRVTVSGGAVCPYGSETIYVTVKTTSNPTISGEEASIQCKSDQIMFHSAEPRSYWQYKKPGGYWSQSYGPFEQWNFAFSDYFNDDDIGKVIEFRSWSYPTGCSTGEKTYATPVRRTFYKDAPSNFNASFQPQTSTCESNAEVTLSSFTFPDGTAYGGEEIEIEFTPADSNLATYVVVRSASLSYTFTSNTQATIMHDDGSETNGLMRFKAGNYTVIITDKVSKGAGASCSSSPKTITFPDPPVFTFQSGFPNIIKEISCNSASDTGASTDGQIQVNIENGKGSYIYTIYRDSNELTSKTVTTNNTSHTFIGLGAGSYYIKVVDDCGSSISSNTVVLAEPTPINIIGSVTNETCNGTPNDGAIDVMVSGGTAPYTYQWSGGSTAITQDVTDVAGSASGINYTLSVKDAKGCVKSKLFTVYEPDAINIIEVNIVDVTCSGAGNGSIDISVTGGTAPYTYEWSNGATTQDLTNLIGAPEGKEYTVVVTDGIGCTTSKTMVIYEPDAIATISNVVNANCSDSNDGAIEVTSITGGTGTYAYEWSTGATTMNVSGLAGSTAGIFYTLTITDEAGCTAYKTFKILAPEQIAATASITHEACYGIEDDGAIDITSVSGGTPPYTYSWSNGATTEDLTNIPAGEYTVTITDANGCTITEAYTITEPFELLADALTSDYNGVGVSCAGATDGFIDVAVSGGTAPYGFSWSNGATTEDINMIGPGIYSVTITDANGCATGINNIEISAPEVVTVAVAEQINVDCFGNATGAMSLLGMGGTGAYEFTVDGAFWQLEPYFSNLAAGDYTFTVRDVNGCSSSVSATITEPQTLTATVSNAVNSTCGDLNGSAEAVAMGGTSPFSFTWYNSSDVVVGNSDLLSGVGGGIYTIVVTDANGCTASNTANISSEDGAQITVANIVATSCHDSKDGQASLDLTGSGPFEVVWDNGETGPNPLNLYPGSNVVTVTDVNGCVVVENIIVPSPEPLGYEIISAVMPACHNTADGSLEVKGTGGSGGYTYIWETGATSGVLKDIPAGIYSLTITDSNGCALATDIALEGVDPVHVDLVNQVLPTCVGDADGRLEIMASGGNGGYSYNWSSGHTGTVVDMASAGTYALTVTDGRGCQVSENFVLADPEPFMFELGEDVEICTGSSLAVTAPVENALYQWASDNGFSSTDQEVTLSGQGNYSLEITNAKGCVAVDNLNLIVSDDLLNADFLMATQAYEGDTVIIIDISWPMPESLSWDFGNNVTVLMENQDYAELVFHEAGVYSVNIEVGLADCKDFYSQSIEILEGAREDVPGGRIASNSEDLIRVFQVNPNPNEGIFVIDIELSRSEDVRIAMVDLNGNRIVLDNIYTGRSNYEVAVDMPALDPGMYILILQSSGTTKNLRLMVR